MNTEKERNDAATKIADALGVPRPQVLVYIQRDNSPYSKEPTYFINALMINPATNSPAYTISSSTLTQMPGCCGMCVSTGAVVRKDLRGNGIGNIMAELRIAVARKLNYSAMICTDVAKNTPQQSILAKFGYERVFSFVNRRTKNEVLTHMRLL